MFFEGLLHSYGIPGIRGSVGFLPMLRRYATCMRLNQNANLHQKMPLGM